MSIEPLLAAAVRAPDDADVLARLARAALGCGAEGRALPLLQQAAAKAGDARLWQYTGLLARALDRLEEALTAFAVAARLAPDDPSIAHGHARVALEAGLPAQLLFDRACALAPDNPEVLFGQVAARVAAGEGALAEAALAATLTRAPGWIDGHVKLGQLRALLGRPAAATESLAQAIAAYPGDPALWQGLFDLLIAAERYDALQDAVDRARAAGLSPLHWRRAQTIALAELGRTAAADAQFASQAHDPALMLWHIRHLLRAGQWDAAMPLIDRALAGADAAAVWPYAAIAWRAGGDPRYAWLTAEGALVRVIELEATLPPLSALADCLRRLHRTGGQFLDQSVRNGSQTDGPLFSRIDPLIRATRAVVVEAVARYRADLPPPDPRHPTLAPRRDADIRFAGSWSVRLGGAGHHANHVHPQGWISSALYIALPSADGTSDPQAGWLTIGAPQAGLGLALRPEIAIEPKPGRLVLFPSWMWHGTKPFAAGERLTIAFDVAPPLAPG